jgi:hypothetical protein
MNQPPILPAIIDRIGGFEPESSVPGRVRPTGMAAWRPRRPLARKAKGGFAHDIGGLSRAVLIGVQLPSDASGSPIS